MKTRSVLLAVSATLMVSCAAHAKVATIGVAALAKMSGLVLIADVVSIESASGVRVARISPVSVVKGRAENQLAFVADRTWTCDISNAVHGERVLLFLVPISGQEPKTMLGQNLSKAASACKKEGVTLYRLAHSGRGRIPIRKTGSGQWCASVFRFGAGSEWMLQVNLLAPKALLVTSRDSGVMPLAGLDSAVRATL